MTALIILRPPLPRAALALITLMTMLDSFRTGVTLTELPRGTTLTLCFPVAQQAPVTR